MPDVFTDEELQSDFFEPGGAPNPDGTNNLPPIDSDLAGEGESLSPVARRYQKKVRRIMASAFRLTVGEQSTVPDAAAIIMHGPDLAEKAGILADKDARFRRGIDMLTEGTENPYLAFAAAAIPLGMQLFRNHEDILSPRAIIDARRKHKAYQQANPNPGKEWKIPGTKRKIRIRFKLHFPAIRNFTNDPNALSQYVFLNPDMAQAMERFGIPNPYAKQNQNGSNPNS